VLQLLEAGLPLPIKQLTLGALLHQPPVQLVQFLVTTSSYSRQPSPATFSRCSRHSALRLGSDNDNGK